MAILWFFVMLLVLILAHELGHFGFAKAFGVKVEEFGIFLPPRLAYFRHGETVYSINLLPLGGFTRMAGEIDPNEVPKPVGKNPPPPPPPAPGKRPHTTLASKSIPVRLIVLGAGSIMNLLLPFVLLSIALMIPHLVSAATGDVIVDSVQAGSPAETAGIKPGDYIGSLNGADITSDKQYSQIVSRNLGKQITVIVRRSGNTTIELKMTPRPDSVPTIGVAVTTLSPGGGILVDSVQSGSSAQQAGMMAGDAIVSIDGTVINSIDAFKAALAENVGKNMQIDVRNKNDVTNTMAVLGYLDPPATGVSIGAVKTESLPFWRAVPQSAVGYWNILLSFKKGIVATIQGTVPFEAAGPVGIAQATVQVARLGIAPLLSFAAFISINLGIVNILPLPALDGGRIFFVLLEWVRRGKRVSPKTENLVHAIGFVLLITLMLLATWGDISRIMSGRSLGP